MSDPSRGDGLPTLPSGSATPGGGTSNPADDRVTLVAGADRTATDVNRVPAL
ncbi:hypothetical protein [Actinomadura sp. KC216]|uniref:hypothetical protein n=1 Tax=Actinomadura sp. KC216 TaxID=2530370 RepID=UPI0014047DD5|nr:hypothetical protein [Actinomadura sp. KC216]